MLQVIAHRGASRDQRENTVAAFLRAADLGSDAVELDVRRTLDGTLVVHHDARLGDGRVIAELPRAELPGHVPTLGEALDACRGMWVNVEIKNDPRDPDFDPTERIADDTVELLLERSEPLSQWLVSCFRLETIDRCRALAPQIRTAWLVAEVPAGAATTCVDHGHVALHPWVHLLDEDHVVACHDAGLAVNTWTCDDPMVIARLIDWGVDGVCTNDPATALGVRGRR